MRNENHSITLAAAQRAIEFNSDDERQGRLLKEELLAREADLGVRIMTRRKRGKRTYFRVTLANIRKHAPDLMPSKAESLLKEAREYLSGIDEKIDDRVAEQITRRVQPRISKLERGQEETSATVRDLAARLKRLADVAEVRKQIPRDPIQ